MSDDKYLKRGNLLWESSRMMLPEHREKLLEKRRQDKWMARNRKREPDEQELERMQYQLMQAVEQKSRVTLICWKQTTGTVRLQGMVTDLNLSAGTCRVTNGVQRGKKLHFSEIMDIETDG